MSKSKEQLKKMVRDIISETISKRKFLKENYNYETEKEIEVEIGGKMYLAKGMFTCDVDSGSGGFQHDWQGGGFQSETETEISNSEFTIEELFPIVDSPDGKSELGPAITDPKILTAMQAHINKTTDFSDEEARAEQSAYDAG